MKFHGFEKTRKPWSRSLLTVLSCISLLSCADLFSEEPNDDNGARGQDREEDTALAYGKLNIVLDGRRASLQLSGLEEAVENCTMYADGVPRQDGLCGAPISVSGFASEIFVQSAAADPHLRGGARLFSQAESTTEPGQILSGGFFDLANPTQNLVGNNNLVGPVGNRPSFRTMPRLSFTEGAISLQHLRYRFQLQSRYVEVLLSKVPQPYAQSRYFSQCEGGAPSSEVLEQDRFEKANLIEGLIFDAGDYLYCIKDDNSACSVADFRWLDLDNEELVSERPQNPHQASSLAITPECVVSDGPQGGQNFDLSWGNLSLMFAFAEGSGFELHADLTHGELSEQWKDEKWPFGETPDNGENEQGFSPWSYYTHSNATGDVSEGSNLEIDLAFSTENLLFIEIDDEASLQSTRLESLLSKIVLSNVWIQDQIHERGLPGPGLAENLPVPIVRPLITVTGGKEPPTDFATLYEASGQTASN